MASRGYVYLSIDKSYPSVLRNKFDPQYMGIHHLPNEISNSGLEPGWNEVQVIGRFSPYQVWGSTSAEEFGFELHLLAEDDYYDDVVAKVEWLKSLKKPVEHEGVSYRPPALIFIWGEFISRRVILKSAEPNYTAPWEIVDTAEGNLTGAPLYPLQATVSISLVAVDYGGYALRAV